MRQRWQAWWGETHGPDFELLRHFLRRFVDSEFTTNQNHLVTMPLAGIPVFGKAFLLLVNPLRNKYARLAKLGNLELYRQAVMADELWLLTLLMGAIGLLTALKWQGLLPDLRDQRALAGLPLRPWQICRAKLATLLLVAAAALAVLNLLPSAGFRSSQR